jgi:hypothetical protein
MPLGEGISLPYFCWGKGVRKGSNREPKILHVSRHTVDPRQVQLDLNSVAVATKKLNNVELLDFEEFVIPDFLPSSGNSDLPLGWTVWAQYILTALLGFLFVGLAAMMFRGWAWLSRLQKEQAVLRLALGLEKLAS